MQQGRSASAGPGLRDPVRGEDLVVAAESVTRCLTEARSDKPCTYECASRLSTRKVYRQRCRHQR